MSRVTMADGERSSGSRLTRRSWTMVAGILPMVALATIVGAGAATVLPTSRLVGAIVVMVVLLLGMAVGVVWHRWHGAEAIHGRVAAVRAEWARTWHDASAEPDGLADPRDAALALPRGWCVEAARGRLRLNVAGTTARVETWVLKPVVGSRRAPRRREVVCVEVPTGGVRVWVPLGGTVDSMLVAPAWAGDGKAADPVWMPAIRDRIANHDDLLAALTIGDDRVILLALDDPRPETTLTRAQLVLDVASMIR